MAVLRASRFQQADHFFTTYAVNAEAGHTIEDVEKPEYWAHVARQARPMDEIVVRADDGSYYARFLVLDSGDTWLKLHRLIHVELQKQASRDVLSRDGEYKISWAGPHDKWRVVRLSDSEKLVSGLASRDAADDWVREYRKVIAPRAKAAE